MTLLKKARFSCIFTGTRTMKIVSRQIERKEPMMDIRLKRAFESPAKSDGTRILVDRIWPRGVRKESVGLDVWMKDIAPSSSLRKWFNHDPAKWEEFIKKYFQELDASQEPVQKLFALAKKGRLTLVFSARDTEHNNAVVLRMYLQVLMSNERGMKQVPPE